MKSVDLNAINSPQQTRTQRAEHGKHQGPDGVRALPVSAGADEIRVSDTAAQIASLVSRAKGAPEVRQDRVDALRELVHSGKYEVPADDIAAAIVRTEK